LIVLTAFDLEVIWILNVLGIYYFLLIFIESYDLEKFTYGINKLDRKIPPILLKIEMIEHQLNVEFFFSSLIYQVLLNSNEPA